MLLQMKKGMIHAAEQSRAFFLFNKKSREKQDYT